MTTKPNAIINPQTNKIIVQKPMPPVTSVALEGGGSRCLAFLGAIIVLKRNRVFDQLLRVSGSSGGAIGALGIALDFGIEEIKEIMLSLNLENFLEGQQHLISQANGLWAIGKTLWSLYCKESHCISSGNEFLKWIELQVAKKLDHPQATFGDLAKRIEDDIAKYGKSNLKYLYVTGTNISLEMPECEHFSHETTPDMPIALAIRISSSLPFVFEPVKWNNHLYSDGGLMQNLPTIFDERRFIPEGYDFTDKGMNPAVLAIKVDSQNEINQELWNIVKEVDLKTAGQVVTAIYNALSQNTDLKEIREARMVLALPDNKKSPIDFSVDEKGKLDLISIAELETLQAFLENYFHGAYDVRSYKSKLDWLNALSLDELDDVILAYQQKTENLEDILSQKDKTYEMLCTYIKFLNQYFTYKRKLKRNPQLIFDGEVPDFHINLVPNVENDGWSDQIEDHMRMMLVAIEQQFEYANERIKMFLITLENISPIEKNSYLRDKEYFEEIQAVTSFIEYRKILRIDNRIWFCRHRGPS